MSEPHTPVETVLHHRRCEIVVRLREHPVPEWDAPLLAAVTALIDAHLAIGDGELAPVLQLVRS